jgi:predicted DNA-binding antitoxin AbrB/MazE fold protein
VTWSSRNDIQELSFESYQMTYQGHFEDGIIVLDEPVELPDGAKVRVELLPSENAAQKAESPRGNHYKHYESIIGAIDDLSEDFAAQHDHYIHGTPKK